MEAAKKSRSATRSADTHNSDLSPAAVTVARRIEPRLQAAAKVSSPHDPAEKEADNTAQRIMRMAIPKGAGVIRQRRPADELQRKAEGTPDVSSSVSAEIRNRMASGEELPLSVRRFMEPRFKADFSKVRIHTDQPAAQLNRQVSARAFTVRNHIFFGRDEYRPDSEEGKTLIAHELTHTIQQGSEDKVQRLGIRDALDYFADRAHHIPGFRMFTLVIGVNPINMSRVDRSPANILRAVVEFMPGGNLVTRALDNHGVFDRASRWVSQQLQTLAITGATIRNAINRFLDSLRWRDIFNLGGVWERARSILTEPINRIMNFVRSLVSGVLQFIKDAILRPLAVLASRTRGWDLLCAVLGRNPITDEPVPRNADTLIGGFMTLIGQQEVWNNIRRANAVGRAWAWFQGALSSLAGFVRAMPGLFISTLRSLGIHDLLDVPRAFARVARVFAGFAVRFVSWAGAQVMQLLQIIFEVVAPGAMPYIRRAAGAFQSIIRNPIGFLGNLVRAGRLGFQRFATNVLTHLRGSLVNWLTGTLAATGVYIPQAFTLREITKFVISALGLTWQNIRQKLVRLVGERVVAAMEAGFEVVRTLITEGPAAAWQHISAGLGNLREMVIEQIMSFVHSRIVQAAITRLLSLLSPAGAFIQAIIGIYNTVMFFIERLRTIAQVAMSFINSIAAIAAGAIAAAAQRVETTMAGLLTLVISFLARIVGLGRVATVVTNLVNRVRAPIERALDRIVDWIVAQARRAGRFILQAGVPQDPQQRLQQGLDTAAAVVNRLPGNRIGEAVIRPVLMPIHARYGFRTLVPELRAGRWWVVGQINPAGAVQTNAVAENAPESAVAAANTALPDQVDVLDSSGAVMIRNYSRSGRTGVFQNGIFSGSVTLSKLKHAPQPGQSGDQTVDVPASTTVQYSLAAANSVYGTPPAGFRAVDTKDPDESVTYSATREAFPEVMRNWWQTEPTTEAARIASLAGAGLVDIDPNGLVRGAQKWHYIYSLLEAPERALLAGPVDKANMSALLQQLPASRRSHLEQRWKQRWLMSTQIHHIQPINFGGENSRFIPVKAEKHIGPSGVHPRFWSPLKSFLMSLR
jgi:hypothetical protein